jgi:hypothetical protein
MAIDSASSWAELAASHNVPEFFCPLLKLACFVKFQVSRFKTRASINGSFCLTVIKEEGRQSYRET